MRSRQGNKTIPLSISTRNRTGAAGFQKAAARFLLHVRKKLTMPQIQDGAAQIQDSHTEIQDGANRTADGSTVVQDKIGPRLLATTIKQPKVSAKAITLPPKL